MDSAMLGLKYLLFLAMEVFVLAALVAVLVLGVYQVVKDKILEARRLDEVGAEIGKPAGVTARHS